jgi:anaerobic magnesium-protoporphyrin IX monomethyl ester cyclase
MKILLVAPPIMDYVEGQLCPIAMDATCECPPYGIYSLAHILTNNGYEVVLADLIARGSNDIKHFLPDLQDCSLVGIGATTLSWPTARDVIKQIRQVREDVPIVLGGIHPTMFDRHILDNFPVQFVIRGEAEIALTALCRALENSQGLSEVPNLSWRDAEGKIIRNPLGPLIPKDELALFPLPDYSELPAGTYKALSIESSRGCAYDCAFCSTSYRRSWRAIPAAAFVDRLASVMEHFDRVQHPIVHIVDDEFSTNPQRVLAIVDHIRRQGLNPQLVYDSRAPDLLADGFVADIAEFTHRFLVGAECGYDEGLQRAGKGTSCRVLEDAARKLYQCGISQRADFSFIIGLPWETRTEVEKTIRFAMHLLGNYGVRVLLQWYCEIPGSRLWQQEREKQLVHEAMYDDYGFFRDLYLFRAGVQVGPSDIWELTEMLDKLLLVTKVHYRHEEMIEFALPDPIGLYFPRQTFSEDDTGLGSLREVSRPRPRGGIPLRRITT